MEVTTPLMTGLYVLENIPMRTAFPSIFR